MRKTSHLASTAAVALGVAMFAPQFTQAQTGPSGSFTNTVSAATNAVWDVGGIFTAVDFAVTNKDVKVIVYYPVAVQQSGSGRLSGGSAGTPVQLVVQGTNVSFSGTSKVTGSISSNRGKGHASFSATVSGLGLLDGKTRRLSASDSVSITFVNATNAALVTVRKSVSAAGKGSISNHESYDLPLSSVFPGGDGSWTLVMNNLSTTGKKVTGLGLAVVTLNSLQTFNFNVNGLFKSDGTSKLVLTGADTASKGSTLQVSMNGNTVTGIKGKISGQSVNAQF